MEISRQDLLNDTSIRRPILKNNKYCKLCKKTKEEEERKQESDIFFNRFVFFEYGSFFPIILRNFLSTSSPNKTCVWLSTNNISISSKKKDNGTVQVFRDVLLIGSGVYLKTEVWKSKSYLRQRDSNSASWRAATDWGRPISEPFLY